ncbi:hypothetical protein DZB84_12325 [Bacillus sp. HNG]|nr:hypothetical protein DZB84_12325 [Bacillus sp. HNG]
MFKWCVWSWYNRKAVVIENIYTICFFVFAFFALNAAANLIQTAKGRLPLSSKLEIFLEKVDKKREKRKEFIVRGLYAEFGG